MSSLDATFAALADPTRRAILTQLTLGERSVSGLAEPFGMSLPAVLKHLDVLGRAGLVEARKDGRVRRCRLEAAPLQEAAAWIGRYRQFWEERFDALELYLGQASQERGEEDDTCSQANPTGRSPSASRGRSRRPGKGSSAPSSKRKR